MKKILFISLFFFSVSLFSQKYFTRSGKTDFKASVEAFEPVEATNSSTTVILTDTGELATQLFINAFQFRVALMQEHFNENYMESNKFPKATFRGKINDFNLSDISSKKEYNLSGTLTVRGVKKEISTKAFVMLSGDKIDLKSDFEVSPQDFNIDIPSIVRKKIADKIKVTLHYELVEKK